MSKYEPDVAEFDSVGAFLGSDVASSGLYSIRHQSSIYTDVLFWNQGVDVTIFCFNGAGAPAGGVRPAYNGTSMFNSWKLAKKANFVFIHDATLYLEPELKVAWYAGSAEFHYAAALESIIRRFVAVNNPDHLIFFGISGGGHAALHYSTRFPGSIAVAGNPQTNVNLYESPFRDQYYAACWPSAGGVLEGDERRPDLNLIPLYEQGTDNFAYCLVNVEDKHHVADHLEPLVKAASQHLNVRTLLQRWGGSHAAPPPQFLLEFFAELVNRRKSGEQFPAVKGSRLIEFEQELQELSGKTGSASSQCLFKGRLTASLATRFDLERTAGKTIEVAATSMPSHGGPVEAAVEFIVGDEHDNRYVYGLRPTADGYEAGVTLRPGKNVLVRTYLPDAFMVHGIRLRVPSHSQLVLSSLSITSYGHTPTPASVSDSVDRLPAAPSACPARNDVNGSAAATVVKDEQPDIVVDLKGVTDISSDLFAFDTPTRVDVVTAECIIPMLVVRRPAAERTVIFSNGAVDLKRSGGRAVFQRSTWWREIEGHQIFVCDPGTVGREAIGLSWGQLSPDYWAVPDISAAVRGLATVFGCREPERHVYFGSSGGGFMSIGLCALDPCSRAVVNNPQLDWTRWMPRDVNNLRSARFGPVSPAEIRAKWPTSSSVLRLITSQNAAPHIDYLVNLASKHDRAVELPMIQEFIAEHPDAAANIRVLTYRDAASGHNPLPKDLALKCLHRDIAEVPLPGT